MKTRASSLVVATAGLVAMPSIVFAHPGHATGGFLAGAMHPLAGVDHLLAMLAIGFWSGQLGKRGLWQIPLAFLLFMILGAALPLFGFWISGSAADHFIAASLLATGLLIVTSCRIPTWTAVGLAALFASFHGYAHASEMDAGVPVASYAAGFLVTTTFLITCGIGTAIIIKRTHSPVAIRLAGVSVALVAALLLGGVR